MELNHVAMRALFRDRQHRYQSAAEMSEELDRFLSAGMHRPTSKSVGHWLEGLFGSERAALKRMIAQGGDIEQALAMLAHTDSGPHRESTGAEKGPGGVRLRPLWSTGTATARGPAPSRAGTPRTLPPAADVPPPPLALAPPPLPTRGPRPTLVGLAVGLVAAVVLTWGLRQRPAPLAAGLGSLRVESNPAGAHLLVDGDPSGFTTPALLRHLRPGRTVELRVVKPGYLPEVRRIDLTTGEAPPQLFTLREATGTVRLEGAPAGATLYLDDVKLDGLQPFSTTVGPHRVRLEQSSDVIFSRSVEVRPGDQSLPVPADRRGR
jgi:hypothetical protein